jgi:ubiquinone/menaquinone biosynthesis C-methylase UbiE
MKKGAEPTQAPITEGRRARRASGVFPASKLRIPRSSDLARLMPAANDPPEQSPEAWSRCSHRYESFAEAVTSRFAQDAVRLVKIGAGTSVLDVATGTGAFALAAARLGADVIATDFSPKMVRALSAKCRKLGESRVRTSVMDGQNLEFEDGSFDVAASLFGLMFFPDYTRGLRELLRVLRPGGQAVIATWAPPGRVEMMRLLGEAAMSAMIDLPCAPESDCWRVLSQPEMLRKHMGSIGFSHTHVMAVTHVCTYESAEAFAKLLPSATPSASAVFEKMSADDRRRFDAALIEGFRERQGDGPYGMTCEGLITVATKVEFQGAS